MAAPPHVPLDWSNVLSPSLQLQIHLEASLLPDGGAKIAVTEENGFVLFIPMRRIGNTFVQMNCGFHPDDAENMVENAKKVIQRARLFTRPSNEPAVPEQ